MTNKNCWDSLSRIFNSRRNLSEIPLDIADNILIAWPTVIKLIIKYHGISKGDLIYDYGCGEGGFSHQLSQLGFKVVGIDSSKEMIELARLNYGKAVDFRVGNTSFLEKAPVATVITSIMVLQFIEDVSRLFAKFSRSLKIGGLLVIVVLNPDYVISGIKKKVDFIDFDSAMEPKRGLMQLGGTTIPVIIRSAEEYNKLAEEHGFKPLFEKYPPFTKKFLKKYPQSLSDYPEYMILGYGKAC